MGWPHQTIRRIFRNEPGVIGIATGQRRTILIPESVLQRVIEKRKLK